MSKSVIIIAGATGNLGGRIVKELASMNASVRVLVRPGLSDAKRDQLDHLGVEIVKVDLNRHDELTDACRGGAVVVSALAGLRDVIVEAQTKLLKGAVAAGVPRFIPSDFAIDFTKVTQGANRNLNVREEFRRVIDRVDIRVTSVLNGAFMDMLTGQAPFILFKLHRILCWGSPDQLMDWTTIADTARYTAFAACDPTTPRYLKIAGDQLSARSLAQLMTELTGKTHRVLRPGGLDMFGAVIKLVKALTPDSHELYPAWQGMQYMHSMYSGLAKFDGLDNGRYPMQWTSARQVLSEHLR